MPRLCLPGPWQGGSCAQKCTIHLGFCWCRTLTIGSLLTPGFQVSPGSSCSHRAGKRTRGPPISLHCIASSPGKEAARGDRCKYQIILSLSWKQVLSTFHLDCKLVYRRIHNVTTYLHEHYQCALHTLGRSLILQAHTMKAFLNCYHWGTNLVSLCN